MDTPSAQIPLGFELSPKWGRDDFVSGPHTEAALALVDSWPTWPAHAVLLLGPHGCGKTHLAHLWAARAGATFASATDLNPLALPPAQRLVLDDVEALLAHAPKGEEALFHLLNRAAAEKGSLLLCADRGVAQWPLTLPDLRSRLMALPVVHIPAPDETARLTLMAKLFADRQLRVPLEVMAYLVTRLERSPAAILQAVAELDAAALQTKRPITQPFARDVLGLKG